MVTFGFTLLEEGAAVNLLEIILCVLLRQPEDYLNFVLGLQDIRDEINQWKFQCQGRNLMFISILAVIRSSLQLFEA